MKTNEVAEKIKALRKGQRLTQQALADAINVKRSTLSNYEIGRRLPSLSELRKIAAFFGVSLDYFGIVAADDLADILARARDVFKDPDVSPEAKDRLYKEIAKLYLNIEKD